MRKLSLLLCFLVSALAASAQVLTEKTGAMVQDTNYFQGTCSSGRLGFDKSVGTKYLCLNGVWIKADAVFGTGAGSELRSTSGVAINPDSNNDGTGSVLIQDAVQAFPLWPRNRETKIDTDGDGTPDVFFGGANGYFTSECPYNGTDWNVEPFLSTPQPFTNCKSWPLTRRASYIRVDANNGTEESAGIAFTHTDPTQGPLSIGLFTDWYMGYSANFGFFGDFLVENSDPSTFSMRHINGGTHHRGDALFGMSPEMTGSASGLANPSADFTWWAWDRKAALSLRPIQGDRKNGWGTFSQNDFALLASLNPSPLGSEQTRQYEGLGTLLPPIWAKTLYFGAIVQDFPYANEGQTSRTDINGKWVFHDDSHSGYLPSFPEFYGRPYFRSGLHLEAADAAAPDYHTRVGLMSAVAEPDLDADGTIDDGMMVTTIEDGGVRYNAHINYRWNLWGAQDPWNSTPSYSTSVTKGRYVEFNGWVDNNANGQVESSDTATVTFKLSSNSANDICFTGSGGTIGTCYMNVAASSIVTAQSPTLGMGSTQAGSSASGLNIIARGTNTASLTQVPAAGMNALPTNYSNSLGITSGNIYIGSVQDGFAGIYIPKVDYGGGDLAPAGDGNGGGAWPSHLGCSAVEEASTGACTTIKEWNEAYLGQISLSDANANRRWVSTKQLGGQSEFWYDASGDKSVGSTDVCFADKGIDVDCDGTVDPMGSISGGAEATFNNATTYYIPGSFTTTVLKTSAATAAGAGPAMAVTYRTLSCRTATTITNTWTFTLNTGGADKSLSCQISGGTSCTDSAVAHASTASSGDAVVVKMVPTSSPTAPGYVTCTIGYSY